MNEQDRVLATLEEYAVAYCAKDLDRLMAIFVDGETVSLVMTEASWKWVHRHASAAADSQDVGTAYPTERK